jgi:hypothetical protein
LKSLGRYLKGTQDNGIHCKPDTSKGLETYVDASYVGDFLAHNPNIDAARSRTGYVIKYFNVPIAWSSRLQSIIALSATEAEYIALSTVTREVLPIIELLQELELRLIVNDHACVIHRIQGIINVDNAGAVEMANNARYRPRTKHIAVRYHFFQQFVTDKTLMINWIGTDLNESDPLTKALAVTKVLRHRLHTQGF